MKTIVFVRHGEAQDDVDNEYGGWNECQLTERGKLQVRETALKVQESGLDVDVILHSPLRRAREAAVVIGETLDKSILRWVYLKERNAYGLLTGINKQHAEEVYPELIDAFKKGLGVLGSEPYESFLERIGVLVELLNNRTETVIICVTHGGVMRAVLEDVMEYSVKNIGDGGMVVVEVQESGWILKRAEGVSFEKD